MKLFIASDIHGSAWYCERMLEACTRENADRMLLLGDILYHGPRNDLPRDYSPKRVAAMLNERKREILCVRGNCEAEVDQMMLAFPVLCEHLMFCADGRTLFATHGHHYHAGNMPPLQPGEILVHGHTHRICCEQAGGNYVLNPGSVSLPKDTEIHSYLLMEDGVFLWKDLDGTLLRRWSPET